MTEQSEPIVLLVDDEDAIRAGLAAALQRASFRVVEARNGREALQKVEQHQPDVIVLDILMPEMDGREVCRRLRQAGNWTPVVMLTARGYALDPEDLQLGNIKQVLSKPFSPRAIADLIGRLLQEQATPQAGGGPGGEWPPSPPQALGPGAIAGRSAGAAHGALGLRPLPMPTPPVDPGAGADGRSRDGLSDGGLGGSIPKEAA